MTRLLAIIGVLCLAACGGGYPQDELRNPTFAAGTPTGTLVVSRKATPLAMTVRHAVLFDGQPFANLWNGESATVLVPAGLHTLDLECAGKGFFGASSSLTLVVEPGQTYRVTTFESFSKACQIRRGD